jgi:hypothetical protein
MKAMVHAELARLGWQWGDAGIILQLNTINGPVDVFVPLQQVWAAFSRFFPSLAGIGCPQGVAGFWGSITRSVRSVSRGVKHIARKVVPKRIQRAANEVYRRARKALSMARSAFQSDIAMYTIMGLALVPGMAPASAGLLAAQQALKRIDAGVRAAEALVNGARQTPALVRAIRRGTTAKRLIHDVHHAARHGGPYAHNFLAGLNHIANGG